MNSRSSTVSRILDAPPKDCFQASDLLPLLYEELHELAGRRMKQERKDHTLQATALVHEAYLRLVGDADPGWAGRSHFFASASEAMRRILIDHARKKGRLKRRSGKRKASISVADLADASASSEILDLDDAIRRLEEWDRDMARVVRLRFFAGLSNKETAEALGTSLSTVKRDWTVARAWLHRELSTNP